LFRYGCVYKKRFQNETTEEIHHHKRHQHDNADEWIASDMTKYESPLADLEREGFDRDAAAAAVNRKTKTDTPPGE
jgi:hypothetical protein